jgi:N-acetylneuraminate synthase
VTDGDMRRWMAAATLIDVNLPIQAIANTAFTQLPFQTPRDQIAARLSSKVRFIPLVDEYQHLIAIARQGRGRICHRRAPDRAGPPQLHHRRNRQQP